MVRANNKLTRFTIVSALILLSGVFLFPILITASNSFMSLFEITDRYTSAMTPSNSIGQDGLMNYVNMSLIPAFVSFQQYIKLLFESPLYLGLFWNSVQITLPVVIGQLLVSVPGAYAFELSKFKYKEAVFFVYIVVMLMPLQVTLVPNFIVADFFGITDSYLAIILPGIFNPFGIFLVRQFMKALPREYIEAAKVDGAGHITIIASLVVPLIKSAIAAVVILTFVEYWNLVDQAVVFIRDSNNEPLSVFLSRLSGRNLDMVFAASTFYMVPAVLIFLFGQKEMVEGIQLSGIK